MSKTAQAITGDIDTSTRTLRFAGRTFTLVLHHSFSNAELSDAGALVSIVPGAKAAGALYRVSIPANLPLKNRNTFCGDQTTSWLVFVHAGSDLGLAAFSGDSEPDLSPAAASTSTSLCGTYLYARPSSR